jgi:hypothetical protein
MAQDQQTDPNALAQDKDFAAATPEEQAKYLSAQDPDFAKASKEDQVGYLQHLTGNPASVQAGLAPAAGAPPSPKNAPSSGEGPIAQGLTSMENKLADMPSQAYSLGKAAVPGTAENQSANEREKRFAMMPFGEQAKAVGHDVAAMNPIVTTEGSLPRNIGATAANVLPMMIDPMGGGIRESAIGEVGRMIPSRARAAATLESVKNVAGNVPVDTTTLTKVVNDALQQKARGGGPLPPPMKAFVKRMSDPTLPPVTYGELRDFASNSGRLSAKANRAMSPTMKKYLGDFSRGAGEANQEAAASVGQEEPYTQGMNEYRRASKMRDFGTAVKKAAIKGAIPTALGYGLYRDLSNRP